MKLIKIAAAALITLSSFAAQAGLLYIDGGTTSEVSNLNDFKFGKSLAALPSGQEYTIGGNLKANQTGSMYLEFSFLGKESLWPNTFSSQGNSIAANGDAFAYDQAFTLGELIEFTFKTGSASVSPNTVVNGANNNGEKTVSFAIALNTTFKGVLYDAILFFDDTGARKLVDGVWVDDDDNHDDLVIGIKATVPESSTFVLMLMGLAGLFAARRLKA